MPKRVAIVDIGSNSARVVIFQRTSRFGFHLIVEQKASVRISEGSYKNGGYLQEKAINRTIATLKSFKRVIEDYKARKILIVATAAVRSAPNRNDFLKKVRDKVGFNIKVIDGNKEAFFGAVAAKNLLSIPEETITIDIGGGSTDIALIKNKKIVDTISIDIGTIKIKELFFDKNLDIQKAQIFIKKEFEKIPKHFKISNAVAIGGVLRAFSKALIEHTNYTFKKIHAFSYNINKHKDFINNIIFTKKDSELKKFFIKENRYDTIREGLLIFSILTETLNIKKIITSGVGIREGIFLNDMLRSNGGNFPKEINPSIISITDLYTVYPYGCSTPSHVTCTPCCLETEQGLC